MADPTEHSHKKQKLSMNPNLSMPAPLFEPPKKYPVAELYEPTMVRITAWDEDSDLEGKHKESFLVPRALICARSAYFDKAFTKDFREAYRGDTELSDVRPWVFRTFGGWLYFQTIYYDPDRTEPRVFAREGKCIK